MTNAVIDNSAKAEIGKVVLWQYDQAPHLLGMIQMLSSFHDAATKDIWDFYMNKVVNIDEASKDDGSDFALSILGALLGIERPTVDGETMSRAQYAAFLKGYAELMSSNFTIPDINKYLRTVFGYDTLGRNKVFVTDGYDMTIHYHPNDGTSDDDGSDSYGDVSLTAEQEWIIENLYDFAFPFPAAVKDGRVLDTIAFGIVESDVGTTRPIQTNGIDIGGLDDSTFYYEYDEDEPIPENERIQQS